MPVIETDRKIRVNRLKFGVGSNGQEVGNNELWRNWELLKWLFNLQERKRLIQLTKILSIK